MLLSVDVYCASRIRRGVREKLAIIKLHLNQTVHSYVLHHFASRRERVADEGGKLRETHCMLHIIIMHLSVCNVYDCVYT